MFGETHFNDEVLLSLRDSNWVNVCARARSRINELRGMLCADTGGLVCKGCVDDTAVMLLLLCEDAVVFVTPSTGMLLLLVKLALLFCNRLCNANAATGDPVSVGVFVFLVLLLRGGEVGDDD